MLRTPMKANNLIFYKIDISNNTRPVVETTRSDQADTKDSKEGFNETEGFEAFIEKLDYKL